MNTKINRFEQNTFVHSTVSPLHVNIQVMNFRRKGHAYCCEAANNND